MESTFEEQAFETSCAKTRLLFAGKRKPPDLVTHAMTATTTTTTTRTSAEVLLKAMEMVLLEGSDASGLDREKSTLNPPLSNACHDDGRSPGERELHDHVHDVQGMGHLIGCVGTSREVNDIVSSPFSHETQREQLRLSRTSSQKHRPRTRA